MTTKRKIVALGAAMACSAFAWMSFAQDDLDDLLKDAMGPHITAQYIAGKKAEWEEFRTHVTDWEVNKYIVMY